MAGLHQALLLLAVCALNCADAGWAAALNPSVVVVRCSSTPSAVSDRSVAFFNLEGSMTMVSHICRTHFLLSPKWISTLQDSYTSWGQDASFRLDIVNFNLTAEGVEALSRNETIARNAIALLYACPEQV